MYLEKPDDVSLYAASLTSDSLNHRCTVARQRVLPNPGRGCILRSRWRRSEMPRCVCLRTVRSIFGSVKQIPQRVSHPAHDRAAAAALKPPVCTKKGTCDVAQKPCHRQIRRGRWRRVGKVVDVARVRVHEALLLRRDLVRPEVVRWHRESIVEVGWWRRTRTGAAKVFKVDLSLTLLFNVYKQIEVHRTNPSPVRRIQAPSSASDQVY